MAGGSVFLTTGWIEGDGALRANGGGSTWDRPSGGGGGRVAVYMPPKGSLFVIQ